MSHTHGPEPWRPVCRFTTKKACDEHFADWQAMQAVLLAYSIVVRDDGKPVRWWMKDRSPDATLDVQLAQYIAGERAELTNKEGNPSMSPFVKRVRKAIERVKAGDLPTYNQIKLPIMATHKEAHMPHPDDVAPETEQASTSGDERQPKEGAFESAPRFAPADEEDDSNYIVLYDADVEYDDDEEDE